MRRVPLFSLVLIAILTQAIPAHANTEPFGKWLADFEQEARAQGISQETLDDALNNISPIERIIELDRKQPESTITYSEYLARVVTEKRIQQGRDWMDTYRDLINTIGAEYGVHPEFMIALWGVETSYGSNTGGYGVVNALATLAYDGRRSEFFRKELLNTLRISEQDGIPASSMKGSWAGAMGQCQFMPSSFLSYAVDYDGDGKRDIWETPQDVFASIANYLHKSGWERGGQWGFEAYLPENFDMALADIKQEKPLSEWKRLGVRWANDDGADNTPASLILVGEGSDAHTYLVFNNYKVLLKWNRSRYFATAVGTLADSIK